MEHEIEKKIRDLKEFIKQKTDQGTANYLGKELRELCGMVVVEMEALRIHDVVGRSEQLVCPECKSSNIEIRHKQQSFKCNDCKEGWAN